MRGMAFLLGTLALVPLASAAIVNFDGIANGSYQGSTTDRDINDLTATGSDGTVFGFRSYDSGNANDATVIDGGRIITSHWSGKLLMKPTSGDVFDLTSMGVLWGWGGNVDFVATGTKADNSLVTQTFVVNSDQTVTFVDFSNLKEVKFDFDGGSNNAYTFFDNISYVVVPEPAALGVLGMSAAAVLIRRRRA